MDSFIIKSENSKYIPSENGLGWEFFECMTKHEDNIAEYIVDQDTSETYGSLLKRSIRTSLKLISLGIKKSDIVTLCTYNHIYSSIPFIAAQFLGMKVASLDPALSLVDTTHLLKQVKPKIIFTSIEALELIENSLKNLGIKAIIVVFGQTENHIPFVDFIQPSPEEKDFKPVKIESNKETAVIFFSSGTTGFPKGICISHYSLMAQSVDSQRHWNIGDGCNLSNYSTPKSNKTPSVILSFTTLYWISGVQILTRCIFTGEARLVCKEFNDEEWWRLIEKYKVTFAFSPPSQANDILRASRSKNVDTSSLKLLLTGSCSVTVKLMEDLKKTFPKTTILQGYGQTEVAGILTTFNFSDPQDLILQNQKPLSCGKPTTGIWYKVVDPETEEILGPNKKGELRYKSEYVMNGYYNMESSSSVFDHDGWVKSGDIVYYDEDKCFYVVDRIKEMFKYKSWHIIPAMLENILCNHPAVKEAVVVGIPHSTDGDHPMGLVVLNKNDYVSCKNLEKDIEKYVEKQVLERQRLRAGVKIIQVIPKTCTGKIKRRGAREMILNNEL